MRVELQNISKKFDKKYLYQGINFTFHSRQIYGIVGPNGSGKSTLLQIIASALLPTRGAVQYFSGHQCIDKNHLHQYISIATPYMLLPEDLSLAELLPFHFQLKPLFFAQNIKDFVDRCRLQDFYHTPIKNFSSGMKQRLRLGLAFCSQSSLLLLDEPCANLDKDNTLWYQTMLKESSSHRTVIICSNHNEDELFATHQILDLQQYKN